MRLWTVHPKFLDAKGLVALWREGLLAKAVLEGKTSGYRKHPQLIRFQAHSLPLEALCEYLHGVLAESRYRGYRFDATKLPAETAPVDPIQETLGQLSYEWQHLQNKLQARDPERFHRFSGLKHPDAHPFFKIIPGGIRYWEKSAPQ